jgi:hypothetical protein
VINHVMKGLTGKGPLNRFSDKERSTCVRYDKWASIAHRGSDNTQELVDKCSLKIMVLSNSNQRATVATITSRIVERTVNSILAGLTEFIYNSKAISRS